MNICVFGDSIAWGACDYARGGWVERLKARFMEQADDINVYNMGVPGDNSEGLRRRFLGEAGPRNPDTVIFAIGINDSKINRADGQSRIGLGRFRDNLGALADAAAGLGARVIFVGLTRVDEALKASPALMPERYYDNARIAEYDDAIRQMCEARGLAFVDMSDIGAPSSLEDGLHPNAAAHEKMAAAVLMTIRDDLNRLTYDLLADEYEERVESLRPVTEEAMAYFASYLPDGGKVLDVGCGVGLAVNVLAQHGFAVTGLDISPAMTAYAQRRNSNATVLTGDFLTLPLPADFDGVLAFAYIHLYPAAQIPEVFARVRDVLKPGGMAFLSSTESAESKEGWHVKEDYGRQERRFRKFWTETELRGAIERAGFEIVDLKKYPDPYGKVWMDFIARKPL